MADAISPETQANSADAAPAVEPNPPGPGSGSKRQRRPSVRLGDIGEQPAAIPHESPVRRSKQWKYPATVGGGHPRLLPSSKRRPVAAPAFDGPLDAPGFYPPAPPSSAGDGALLSVDDNLEPLAAAIRRRRDTKPRRSGAEGRRPRSSWTSSKSDGGVEPASAEVKSSGSEDAGEKGSGEFGDLWAEDSESPSGRGEAAAVRVRVPEANEVERDRDVAEEDVPSEDNGGGWNNRNGQPGLLEDGGVRAWLSRLGLERYAPMFEIHEVDDEVLPLLTMEDLKDMGINAVGSRRKMHCAIQKFKKMLSQEHLDACS